MTAILIRTSGTERDRLNFSRGWNRIRIHLWLATLTSQHKVNIDVDRAVWDHARRWAQPRLGGTMRDAVKRSAQTKVWFAIGSCIMIWGHWETNQLSTAAGGRSHCVSLFKGFRKLRIKARWKTYAIRKIYKTRIHCLLDVITFTIPGIANPALATGITPRSVSLFDADRLPRRTGVVWWSQRLVTMNAH